MDLNRCRSGGDSSRTGRDGENMVKEAIQNNQQMRSLINKVVNAEVNKALKELLEKNIGLPWHTYMMTF